MKKYWFQVGEYPKGYILADSLIAAYQKLGLCYGSPGLTENTAKDYRLTFLQGA